MSRLERLHEEMAELKQNYNKLLEEYHQIPDTIATDGNVTQKQLAEAHLLNILFELGKLREEI